MDELIFNIGDWVKYTLEDIRIIGYVNDTYKGTYEIKVTQPEQLRERVQHIYGDKLQHVRGASALQRDIDFSVLNVAELRNLADMALDTRDFELFKHCAMQIHIRERYGNLMQQTAVG